MSDLYLYQCPTCASRLKHDIDSNIFKCDSCGNTFEYFCFMEESPLTSAEENLARRRYQVAKKEYEFVLTTDPHNAIALKGLELCNLGIKNINAYLLPKAAPHKNFDFDSYVRRADEEYKPYFAAVSVLDSNAQTTRDLNNRIIELKEEIAQTEVDNKRLNHLAYEEWDDVVVWRDRYQNETTAHTMFYFYCLLGISAIISAIVTVCTKFSYVAIGFLVVTTIACLISYLMIARTLGEMKEARKRVPAAESKYKNLTTELRDTTAKFDSHQIKIREDFNKAKELEIVMLTNYGILKEK